MGSGGLSPGQQGNPAAVLLGMAWAGGPAAYGELGLGLGSHNRHPHPFWWHWGAERVGRARASLDEAYPQGSRGCHEDGQPCSLSMLPALGHLPSLGEEADRAAAVSQGMTGSGVGQRGPRSHVQLCSKGGGAGEVKVAGQMLVQLLSRGDRWDKQARALRGPVN